MSWFSFVIACAFVIEGAIAYLVGFIAGSRSIKVVAKEEARTEVSDEMARLRNLLARAGFNLDDELPSLLQDAEDPSGSWTGIPVDNDFRVPPGSIPRWDQPTRHKE